jgi:hypothetical protein
VFTYWARVRRSRGVDAELGVVDVHVNAAGPVLDEPGPVPDEPGPVPEIEPGVPAPTSEPWSPIFPTQAAKELKRIVAPAASALT